MGGLSPYEQVKIGYMQNKRSNGVGITALVLGSVGLVAGIGSWIFGPTYAKAQSERARDVANARYEANQNQLNLLTNLLAAERNERVAQGVTMTQTITDSIAGTQQGTQAQTTSVENSAMAQATTQLLTQSLLGNLSENAQKVQLYSAPSPCSCPNSCCNG